MTRCTLGAYHKRNDHHNQLPTWAKCSVFQQLALHSWSLQYVWGWHPSRLRYSFFRCPGCFFAAVVLQRRQILGHQHFSSTWIFYTEPCRTCDCGACNYNDVDERRPRYQQRFWLWNYQRYVVNNCNLNHCTRWRPMHSAGDDSVER